MYLRFSSIPCINSGRAGLASWRCSRGRPPSPASAATGTGVGTGTGARRGAVVVVAWEADAQGGADQAVGDGCVSLGGQHHEQVSARCSHRTTHRRDEDGDRDKDGEESRILVTKKGISVGYVYLV
jgi:hypothetical protein